MEDTVKQKHSKGPWSILYPSGIDFKIVSNFWGEVCGSKMPAGLTSDQMDEYQEEQYANAQLIASAPDLLEALEEAVEYMPLGMRDKAQEAIKKAKGL